MFKVITYTRSKFQNAAFDGIRLSRRRSWVTARTLTLNVKSWRTSWRRMTSSWHGICPRTQIPTRQSPEEDEKAKTTFKNIAMHYHNKVTKFKRNTLYSYLIEKGDSEMKHIEKDYKDKIYISLEFYVDQMIQIVDEKNVEDHAVSSDMKLIEKLIEEEKSSWSPTLTKHIVLSSSLTFPFLRLSKESWKLSQHSTGANPRTSHYTDRQHVRTHTQSGGEDRQIFSISRSKLRKHRIQRWSWHTFQSWTSEQVVNSVEMNRTRSSRQCRTQSLDLITIKQTKINHFDK